MTLRHRFPPVRRGTSLVEMALVMTLLLYIVLGAIEYGYLFLRQQQITNAARQGARLAATPDATASAVTTQIDTMMTSYGMPKGTYNYTTTLTPSNIQPGTGQTLQVQVSVNYKNNLSIVNSSLCPVPSTLTASVTMEKEGP